jgi:mRNA interferase MazF
MSKGDIVLVPFPFTDLSGNKVRPAVLLHASKKSQDCIVAFISSVRDKTSSFNVKINKSSKNNLKSDSVIKVDKITTLDKKMVIGKIGKVENEYIKIINEKIKIIFGL